MWSKMLQHSKYFPYQFFPAPCSHASLLLLLLLLSDTHTHTHPHLHISHTHGNHIRCWCSEKKVCGWLFSSFFKLSEGLILRSCGCCFLLFVSCHHFLDLRDGLSWVQSLWRHGSNRQWETKTLLTLWECVCECFWSTLGHVLVQFMIVWQR